MLGEFALGPSSTWSRRIALYDPQQHHSLPSSYAGMTLGWIASAYAAWTLWYLGYPDQALKRSQEALALAQELSHPFSLAYALAVLPGSISLRREEQAAQERAEAAIALSTEQGFPYWLAMGTILRGWALAEQGQGEEGIAQMHQGLAALRATGAEMARPYYLALLAEAYGKAGQAEEGLTVLAEALAVVDKTGERFYEAELYRLKGRADAAAGVRCQEPVTSCRSQPQSLEPQAEAEACFLKAIEIAQRQQAKSLELRAAMSLARLWQQQGKQKEAHQMLAEIYDWFTEGFDTKDLQEAKALLAELAEESLMDLYAVIDQVVALLQQRGRLTYRALKCSSALMRSSLRRLKSELIDGQQVAVDEDGKVLVWTGRQRCRLRQRSAQVVFAPSATPPAQLYAPRIWPSASVPSKQRWKRAAPLMASAKSSPRCLPISKARRR